MSVLAPKYILNDVRTVWVNKMGMESNDLFNDWLQYGPWVEKINNLSMQQAYNLIAYMNKYDPEHIVWHIMDLIH